MKPIVDRIEQKSIIIGWTIVLLSFFLFSFTQIEPVFPTESVLGISSILIFLRNLGLFHRTFVTTWYSISCFFIVMLYITTYLLILKKKITKKTVLGIFILISFFGLLSYPAYSRDIYNYIFSGKIIVVYHKDPGVWRPLDFALIDNWLNFMNWTHIPSVYPVFMNILGAIVYIGGFSKLVTSVFLMKFVVFLSFVGIWKAIEKHGNYKAVDLPLLFASFLCNPLLFIEFTSAGHNDSIMVYLALLGLVSLEKQLVLGIVQIISSILIKYSTAPLLVFAFFPKFIKFSWIIMSAGLIFFLVVFKRELYPWYSVWIFPFLFLDSKLQKYSMVIGSILSGFLYYYSPYFFFGNWDYPVSYLKYSVPLIAGIFFGISSWYLLSKNSD